MSLSRHLTFQGPVMALTLSCLLANPLCAQEILPDERRIEWDPGVPGGIPEVTGPEVSVMDHGADSTGATDSRPAFSAAIAALPEEGGLVLIPIGTFRLASTLSIGKSGAVLRGSGPDTRIISEVDGNSIEIVTYERGNWQSLPMGLPKKGKSLMVSDGSLFTVGHFVEVSRENDAGLMYSSPDWNVDWAQRAVGQLFEVVAIEDNILQLSQAAHHAYDTALAAEARPINLLRGVGLEDFYLKKTEASGHSIYLKNTAYCWIRNVESDYTRKYHVGLNTCLGNEIRDSYFHRSYDYGGGGSAYGVECGYHVGATLVENNIFDSLRHAMMVHLGASGNVFGYNYSAHPLQGSGENNLNLGWDPPDLSIHGHYPLMNLFEGNHMEEVGIGDYWGPAGPGNTYFRNRVNSAEGIVYYDYSHKQNLLGNITPIINDPLGTAIDEIEHGNVINGIIRWDPEISNHSLPPSYYLEAVPDFFGDLAWPPYGPDVEDGKELPARLRYEALMATGSAPASPAFPSSVIRLWPNPTSGQVHMSGMETGTRIRLLDISGKVHRAFRPSGTRLDLSEMENGLYFLEFIAPDGDRQLKKILRH